MNSTLRQGLIIIVVVIITTALLLSGVALGRSAWAQTNNGQSSVSGGPWGYGMMGPGMGYNYDQPYAGSESCAYGMMGGSGMDMMGGRGYDATQGCESYGMMGPWGGTYPEGTETLSLDEAKASVEHSLQAWNNDDLEVAEVMEFGNHFYALVHEESSGIGAFEVLVDKVTGVVSPEPGPNMMWNQKYGMMGGGYGGMGMMGGGYGGGYGGMDMMGGGAEAVPSADMPVDETRAVELAQDYLDTVRPGAMTDAEADTFYGYYTLHVLTDGQVTGMLSVNGYTGQVWYHTWHGSFVDMAEEGHGPSR